MSFTNPIWLWGMTGLIIPIAIHLLSRKEGKVIAMGSLRFLTESPTAQFRHIRLNELALLILRCLLLTIIVFLLAGLKIDGIKQKKERWMVLEQGVQNSEWKNIIDSSSTLGFQKRLLADNFPAFTETRDSVESINYWSLLNDLKRFDLDSVIVISYNFATNFKGERLTIPEHVHWITTDPPEKKFVAATFKMTNDSLWIRSGTTNSMLTEFKTINAPIRDAATTLRTSTDTLTISIFSDTDYTHDQKIIVAALQAIENSSPLRFKISNSLSSDFMQPKSGWIIWLSGQKMPESNLPSISAKSGVDKTLPLIETDNKVSLIDSSIRATNWVITKRLTQENALSENLTLTLSDIFNASSTKESSPDNRTIPNELAWSRLNQVDAGHSTLKNDDLIGRILIMLLILTLFFERTLAFKRNQ